jgi:hypothetical protein
MQAKENNEPPPDFKITVQFIKVVVFNATFNNISAISWQSVLLVEVTRVTDKLYHILFYNPWILVHPYLHFDLMMKVNLCSCNFDALF